MFGASLIRYARVGARSCEHCGLQPTFFNPAVHCERCDTLYCRRCFARSCVFTIGSTIIALPVMLRSRDVCDSCVPEDAQEHTFTSDHTPFMTRGEMFDRAKPNILGGAPSKEMIILALDISKRSLTWRSMELVNQQPKSTGTVLLDDIDRIEISSGDVASARSLSRQESHIRFFNARGQLLLWVCTDDSRQHTRWNAAMTQCRAILRYSHQRVFPSVDSVREDQRTSALNAEKEAEAERLREEKRAYRERISKERETFRESLGNVGMSTTAKIMSERATKASSDAGSKTVLSETEVQEMPAHHQPTASKLKDIASQAWSAIGSITTAPTEPKTGPTTAASSARRSSLQQLSGQLRTTSSSSVQPTTASDTSSGNAAPLDALRSGISRFGLGLSEAAKSVANNISGKGRGR